MSFIFYEPPFDQPVRRFAPVVVVQAPAATPFASAARIQAASGVFEAEDFVQPGRRFAPPPPAILIYPAPSAARRQALAAFDADEFAPPPRRFAPVVVASIPRPWAGAAWRVALAAQAFEADAPSPAARRFAPLASGPVTAPLTPQPVILIPARAGALGIGPGGRSIAIPSSPRSGRPVK